MKESWRNVFDHLVFNELLVLSGDEKTYYKEYQLSDDLYLNVLQDNLLTDPDMFKEYGGANIYIRMNYNGCTPAGEGEQMSSNLEDSGVKSINPLNNMTVLIMALFAFLLTILVLVIAALICCKYR